MTQRDTIHAQLKRLGFTANESIIYLTLIRKGALKAGEIIQITKLQRSVVYTCLKSLLERKLILEKENHKVSIFLATNPKELVNIENERVALANQLAEDLLREKAVLDREAYVYEGEDIVTMTAKKTLEIKKGDTVYFFGSSKFGVQSNLEKFWLNYHKDREKLGICAKILYDNFTPTEIVTERNNHKGCEARYLPIEVEMPISFIIWGDHVAILVPGERPPTAFFIKNRDTADALIEYFNYLWKQTKPSNYRS